MRVLVCVSVVLTHVVFNANRMQSLPSNTLVNLLHFTRQSFFFISALVLVYAYQGDIGEHGNRRRQPAQLRRRISVIGVPYLLWTTFYALLGLTTDHSSSAVAHVPRMWLGALLKGTGYYHMYFLLVSLEFAVVFPLFIRLLYATRRRHGVLLLSSALVELATLAVFHYRNVPVGRWQPLVGESSLIAYQFWLLAGGVAALHLPQLHEWLVGHKWWVIGGLPGMFVVATGVFFADLADGKQPEFAGRASQPVTVPLALAAIGALYLISVWFARNARGWMRQVMQSGAYLSFGIYLCHPAILTGLLYLQKKLPGTKVLHRIPATAAILVLDIVLAVGVAALFSRTSWSKALIGRSRRERTAPVAAPSGNPHGSPSRASDLGGNAGMLHPPARNWQCRVGARSSPGSWPRIQLRPLINQARRRWRRRVARHIPLPARAGRGMVPRPTTAVAGRLGRTITSVAVRALQRPRPDRRVSVIVFYTITVDAADSGRLW
jgi:peptidoglycan/LPS O-acetylase OafA/YrhL